MWLSYAFRISLPVIVALGVTVHLWSTPLPSGPQRRPEYVAIQKQRDQLSARLDQVRRVVNRPMARIEIEHVQYLQLQAESVNLPPQIHQLKVNMVAMKDPGYHRQWNAYYGAIAMRGVPSILVLCLGVGLAWYLRGEGYAAYSTRRKEQRDRKTTVVKNTQIQAFTRSARKEVERFYESHTSLQQAVPRALFVSTLNAQFTEDMEPKAAWEAARALLEQLNPLVDTEAEKPKKKEKPEKLIGPPAPVPSQALLRDVIAELRLGLSPEVIAQALEEKLGGTRLEPPRYFTQDDMHRL